MIQTPPLTKGNAPVKARFFKLGNKDMIEIAIIGDHNTYEGKVTPKDIADYPKEWEAYQAGLDMPEIEGTPLIDVPGMTQQLVQWYKFQGIYVAEQLAEASDIVVQKLGMGSNTFRKNAQILLKSNQWEKNQAMNAAKHVEPKGHAAAVDSPIKKAEEAVEEADNTPIKKKPGRPPSKNVAPEVPR